MVVTATESVTGSRPARTCGSLVVCRGSSCNRKWNAWKEGEAIAVGETEVENSSGATEVRGPLARWAIANHERARIGLRQMEDTRVLERTIVEDDE